VKAANLLNKRETTQRHLKNEENGKVFFCIVGYVMNDYA
jgi:hypothetical protein